MLPTDERFKSLTDKQKNLLLSMYLEFPTSEVLHTIYEEEYAEHPKVSEEEEEGLKRLGYSPEQIKKMKEEE